MCGLRQISIYPILRRSMHIFERHMPTAAVRIYLSLLQRAWLHSNEPAPAPKQSASTNEGVRWNV